MKGIAYYKISKTNTADTETDVITLTSSKEVPLKILSIIIWNETNDANLLGYINREVILEAPGGTAPTAVIPEIEINQELQVGDVFKLTSKNAVAGTNYAINGLVKVEVLG